eukprot:gene10880-biopygen18342
MLILSFVAEVAAGASSVHNYAVFGNIWSVHKFKEAQPYRRCRRPAARPAQPQPPPFGTQGLGRGGGAALHGPSPRPPPLGAGQIRRKLRLCPKLPIARATPALVSCDPCGPGRAGQSLVPVGPAVLSPLTIVNYRKVPSIDIGSWLQKTTDYRNYRRFQPIPAVCRQFGRSPTAGRRTRALGGARRCSRSSHARTPARRAGSPAPGLAVRASDGRHVTASAPQCGWASYVGQGRAGQGRGSPCHARAMPAPRPRNPNQPKKNTAYSPCHARTSPQGRVRQGRAGQGRAGLGRA